MPCRARLDAPHTLHHVMVRGIERTTLFRADCVARVAALAAQGAWTIYAWALSPNHAHLLVRTRVRTLSAPLGIRTQNVYRSATQGQAAAATWQRILPLY